MTRRFFAVALGITVVAAAVAGACGGGAGTVSSGTGGQTPGSTSSASSSKQASSTSGPLPPTFTVTGIVVDENMAPLAGAFVMQGGASPDFVTGADGTFSITLTTALPGTPTIVAGKIGYRSIGDELYKYPVPPETLVVRAAKPPDNVAYVYGNPGVGNPGMDNNTSICGHCHTRFVADFQTSAHAAATSDPFVQDLYAGVASAIATQAACVSAGGTWKAGVIPGQPMMSAMKCYIGVGVLPDLNGCGSGASPSCDDPALSSTQKPTHFGTCADCHAAGIDGPAGGRNLHDAGPLAFKNGNHCDVCHHVRDIDATSSAPGVAGRLLLQRPSETKDAMIGAPLLQVMYGPYPDSPNFFMGGSYQPKFKSAEFCSGCHEYNQAALMPGSSLDATKWPNGLPSHSVYSEWSASSFNAPAGKQCQDCHMPKISGMFNDIDVATPPDANITFGFGRTDMHAHVFLGPLDNGPDGKRLTDAALTGNVKAVQSGSLLNVDVSLTNVGAGHAIPTSEPMRALLLALRVDGCGSTFVQSSGLTVPDFGGASVNGTVGAGVTVAGATVTWPAAVSAKVGDRVRIVRPSGQYEDYPGIGYFGAPGRTPQEKGMEIDNPVGEADIIAVVGSTITLSTSIAAAAGDVAFLGDALPPTVADNDPSRGLAGAAGFGFARVMVDPSGRRFSPHYRSRDIASDNRLPTGQQVTTQYAFAIPAGCTSATVQATLLYRQVPLALSRERGWSGQDAVVFSSSTVVPLQ